MNIEIINTGSELMLGRILNTHQQWLCAQFAALGFVVTRQVAVADTAATIQQTVREALGRGADVIVTTGGLGPTSDDLTREAIASLLGRTLETDAAVLQKIEAFFAERRRVMPASTRVQAQVPAGAEVLPNDYGTAPGLAMDVRPNPYCANGQASLLIMLPGPPRELHPMFQNQVVPLLERRFPSLPPFVCRTLKTTGLGESVVEEKVAKPLEHLVQSGLELGYCARPGEVEVRLSARGAAAEAQVKEGEAIVRHLLGTAVYGVDDDSLEAVVVRLLTERHQTLALAESCTGGLIANRVTNVAGASAVFLGGLVTYSNQAKQDLLGVRPETLASHGAVSEETATEMAEAVRRALGADYALAVTGIAGPSGGTPTKPVGTVYIALASTAPTQVEHRFNPLDRETFKRMVSEQALALLRSRLVT